MTVETPEYKLVLRKFANEQMLKAQQLRLRKDEVGLDESIKVVDRIVADYLELREKLVLLRA